MLFDLLRLAGAAGCAVALYLIGAGVVRNFARAEPPPDPAETPLADVDYRYQCVVCGAQVLLYAAPEGDVPDAPRHCREQMVLVAPVTDE